MNNPSPLEQLAAFALCFVAGAVSVVAIGLYTRLIRPSRASKEAAVRPG